ncbi:diaminohydroxyphosphoribosylaminopyrimidine deaminase [Corynebacterium kutscheri]|uniref:Riboflavin biosynthesis protein RibD n=1 Tax=Corynebacterium kutscheri TaxID=35755 RepID=A0A0F6R1X4_9CORY|nr:bifunctional diaminohydroxyphosphoribosylaminopyrimidine deaminase/5-amino-6-(5-phosphoribosylamino)uracil reductase RibD [Corynebacterium kutscheri]AKE41293.1 diaminohydroxyphosphoribosylaminopyrimidine deaminase [Corynebacterium kutscheri]VEH09615.1 diaminohydroxyphosphoribosylaminopyrimidine deaminase/5-amino-6-(5-phosphoribosylamino)uracil reductase [Corynebacterium kutscheri]
MLKTLLVDDLPRSTAPIVLQAIKVAAQAAEQVWGTTSPNPSVGAAIISASGKIVGVGATQPVGGAHAEVMALHAAGAQARGGHAVVTLEPCNHQGRTGPCSQALLAAGIKKVTYLCSDPYPQAAGGAEFLSSHGIEVECLGVRPRALVAWLFAIKQSRPAVTLKWAHTLDGFIAAQDGMSQWITGVKAREYVHHDRSHRDAIIIGTGTAFADRPQLTARYPDGSLYLQQPRRVVIGRRTTDLGFEQFTEIELALNRLWDSGARDVLVEGGHQLWTSFLQLGLVDFIHDYTAPALLGAGIPLLAQSLTENIAGIYRFEVLAHQQLGVDSFSWLERK